MNFGLPREFRPWREALRNAVRFWQDATLVKKRTVWPHAEGEIFFTAPRWELHPLPLA